MTYSGQAKACLSNAPLPVGVTAISTNQRGPRSPLLPETASARSSHWLTVCCTRLVNVIEKKVTDNNNNVHLSRAHQRAERALT